MEGHHTALIPAISAVDCLVADLRIDPGVFGVQVLKASYVLRDNARLATDNNVVLIQIGSVGDNTFCFSGFKHAQFAQFFGKLISIYGEEHDSVYYVAPIFPGFDPIITVRKLREYRDSSMQNRVHAASLYLPPAGVSFDSLTELRAFKNREPYGKAELDAISELEFHRTPPGYSLRGASAPMVRAVLELATCASSAMAFRRSPDQFVGSHPDLEPQERQALLSRDAARMRAATTIRNRKSR